jgi:bifunctional NMN adenylyltransferase/nudix hydrolase
LENNTTLDTIVYIGRFQPFHVGHLETVKNALTMTDNLIIVVGSAFKGRTPKNPFTYTQRKDFIEYSFSENGIDESKVTILPQRDFLYCEADWQAEVRRKVTGLRNDPNGGVGIIGYDKDESSYYLSMFPDWTQIQQPPHSINGRLVNATDIRERFLAMYDPTGMMCMDYGQQMRDETDSDCGYHPSFDIGFLQWYTREYTYIADARREWCNSPYPVSFDCADAFVYQSGHILMVERKRAPGRGQFALPGGYINMNETRLQGAIRELREETRLKVPEKVLRGSIFAEHCFDYPTRSERGRVYSHAFGFKLDSNLPLPNVRGDDDALRALWVPVEEVQSNKFRSNVFEDHSDIIEYFLGRIKDV